nr:TPM domain-containing protein [Nitrospirota bacterium]
MVKASVAAWVLMLAWAGSAGPALALPGEKTPLPEPLGYVTDHAGVVGVEWKANIRSVCQDLERKTGVEMVIVTVKTIKPYKTANDYAEALYQRWGIGTAQKGHGVLVLAAVEERQAAITMGRSLLGVITPKILEQVSTQYIEPSFRKGQFEEGLYRTSVALASAAQEIRVGDPPRSHLKGLGIFLTLFTGFGALAFLWWISRPDLRHPFGRLRRGEYWGSGQGGFGGNFGGFGGGMGGEGLS